MVQRVLIFCLLLLTQAPAQQRPDVLAQQALEDLKFIVDETNYLELGFESLSDLDDMTLGDALPVHFVALDLIQRDDYDSIDGFYGEVQELVFPVWANDDIRTSVVLKKDANKWEVAGFGRERMTDALAIADDIRSVDYENTTRDYFAMEIPSLFLLFICFKEGDDTLITYVSDEPSSTAQPFEPRILTEEEQLREDIFIELEDDISVFDEDVLERIRFLAEVAQDPLASEPIE